jgi:tetratricopeptide (TPR) repeat protein
MDPYLVLVLVLLLYILLVGGLSLLRREGLSARYAGELLLIGALLLGAARLVRVPSPVVFFVALYLVSMRVRLLVDAGNRLAMGGRAAMAERMYGLALRLATNPLDRLIVGANRGAALLHRGQVPEAIASLEKVLSSSPALGLKLEAACRCNLGLAYLRQGQVGRGRAALWEAMDLLPGSVYARRAQMALQQLEGPASEQ